MLLAIGVLEEINGLRPRVPYKGIYKGYYKGITLLDP